MLRYNEHMDASETWVNEHWDDLQTVRNPVSQREKLLVFVMTLAIPESEWERHGMRTLGPQRWRNHVQDIDLHKYISLLESKVQVPLTTTYEEVGVDVEHSDTDDEDHHVDYQEYHSSSCLLLIDKARAKDKTYI